jgi:hypothetical protein
MAFYLVDNSYQVSPQEAEDIVNQLILQIAPLPNYTKELPEIATGNKNVLHEGARPLVTLLNQAGVPLSETKDVVTLYLEAVENAYEHGNNNDPTKIVRAEILVGTYGVMISVHDQGKGISHIPEGQYLEGKRTRGCGFSEWISEGVAYRDADGFHVHGIHLFENQLPENSQNADYLD